MQDKNYLDVAALKQEVADLEQKTIQAIEDLETELLDFSQVLVFEEDDWSPRLDTIDIITMEELPPLKESIRKISLN